METTHVAPAVTWQIKSKTDETLVTFTGTVDERADFSPLKSMSGKASFDLAGIRRINSEGVRLWIELMRALDGKVKLSLVRCSVQIVYQLNMIKEFGGKAEVRSFYAPYVCVETGKEEDVLLTKEQLPDPLNPPTFPCDGGTMSLDDMPESYFAFLRSA